MEIVILRDGDTVGTYDEDSRRLESRDARLLRMVEDGITALGAGAAADGYEVDAEVTVLPDDPEWFFHFLDELWRQGYDVHKATYEELFRRRPSRHA